MKFSIQHPSNWQVDDSSSQGGSKFFKYMSGNLSFVSFNRPDRGDCINCYFAVSTDEVEPLLNTRTMKLENKSLEQYVEEIQKFDSERSYKLIRENEVTVSGNPGWKFESTDGFSYKSKIITVANGKFYILSYVEDPLKVPEMLPLVNKMVESFQIKIE
jgi:hypothetical protein